MYILSFSARIGNLLEQHANPHAGKTNLWLLALYATVALSFFVQREIYLFIIPITSELTLWGIAYLHALFIVCCLDLVHICSRLTNGFRIVTTNAESPNKWRFERGL